ncbi:amidase [Streptomyces sp. NPDC001292]|uniref:amidase n=1 Tax=Streptomyces sp. NPDC001292 TaxID=3364558 RepID=UPI0036CB13A2
MTKEITIRTPTNTSTATRLEFLTAAEALDGFRSGEFAPSEVLAAHWAQADRVNGPQDGGINALSHEYREASMQQACEADDRYALARTQGTPTPALLGLAVAAKEKHAIAGEPVSQGLLAQTGHRADADMPIIERIRAAGGIVHARTTTPEFSCASVTHSKLWGVTRNPWNTDAGPGGSSGGAGAALAAGLATLATASDIGGSTRIPAGFCGVIGYKAPYGRVPGAAPLSADWYRGDGPMARTVLDTALLASVMSGQHASDHTSWGPQNSRELIDIASRPETDLRGVRIAYEPTLGGFPVDADVATNTKLVIETLADAGADIVEVRARWDVEQVLTTCFSHFGQIMGNALADAVDGDLESLSPYAQRFVGITAQARESSSLFDSIRMDLAMQAEVSRMLAGANALITPTSACAMLPADGNFLDGITLNGTHYDNYMAAHMTMPFNTANRCPVLAVPSGRSACGVPTSVQIVGAPLDEASVFRIGAVIETLLPPLGIAPGM